MILLAVQANVEKEETLSRLQTLENSDLAGLLCNPHEKSSAYHAFE